METNTTAPPRLSITQRSLLALVADKDPLPSNLSRWLIRPLENFGLVAVRELDTTDKWVEVSLTDLGRATVRKERAR